MTRRDGPPHRFPFRLVERVDARGSRSNPTFLLTGGGFFGRPGSWPVTLVAEALAQAIAMVHGDAVSDQVRLVALHGVRLRRELSAGDRVEVELKEEGRWDRLRRYACRALRGGAPVAEATVSVTV